MGYSSLEDFLVSFWEGFFLKKDANNLLAMLWICQNGNIGNTLGFDGNFEKALEAIQAKAIVMPCEKDLYFPPEDNVYAVKFMLNGNLCRMQKFGSLNQCRGILREEGQIRLTHLLMH